MKRNSIVTLAVTKCTSSKNGGYVLTLVHKSEGVLVATPFGNTIKTGITTYYMKVDEPIEVGFDAPIDLSGYDIVERPFTTNDNVDIDLKWLHIK